MIDALLMNVVLGDGAVKLAPHVQERADKAKQQLYQAMLGVIGEEDPRHYNGARDKLRAQQRTELNQLFNMEPNHLTKGD